MITRAMNCDWRTRHDDEARFMDEMSTLVTHRRST
jgi:predicted small metal-binding protein